MLKDGVCVSKHVFSAAMMLKHVLNDALGSGISLQTENILIIFTDKEPTMWHIC